VAILSEQVFIHWYLSEDPFSETWEDLGRVFKTLESVTIGSVKVYEGEER
jgi:hypothetical protein